MKKTLKGGAILGLFSAGAAVWFIDIASLVFRTSSFPDQTSLTTTNVAMRLIIGLFLFGVVQLIARWAKAASFASSIPSHLTALGILGTFVGIFLGLYKFDTSNLKESVPQLLDGLKIAFSTSIVGLSASTALKVGRSFVVAFFGGPDPFQPPAVNIAPVPEDPLLVILGMSDADFRKSLERLEQLRNKMKEMGETFETVLNRKKPW